MKNLIAAIIAAAFCSIAGAADYQLNVPGNATYGVSAAGPWQTTHSLYGQQYADTVTLNVSTAGTYTVTVEGESLVRIGSSGRAHPTVGWYDNVQAVSLGDVALTDEPFQQTPVRCVGSNTCHPWLTDLYSQSFDLQPGQYVLSISGWSYASNPYLGTTYTVTVQ